MVYNLYAFGSNELPIFDLGDGRQQFSHFVFGVKQIGAVAAQTLIELVVAFKVSIFEAETALLLPSIVLVRLFVTHEWLAEDLNTQGFNQLVIFSRLSVESLNSVISP